MKIPPREKIHEALSAIADDRIVITSDNSAEIYSSNNTKKYLVEWNENEYSSNDNGTFWQGYPGYPIIAILLIKDNIIYDKNIVQYFKNINWKEINTKFNNDYAKAVNSVYQELESQGVDIKYIDNEISKIYDALKTMGIIVKKSKLFPPK